MNSTTGDFPLVGNEIPPGSTSDSTLGLFTLRPLYFILNDVMRGNCAARLVTYTAGAISFYALYRFAKPLLKKRKSTLLEPSLKKLKGSTNVGDPSDVDIHPLLKDLKVNFPRVLQCLLTLRMLVESQHHRRATWKHETHEACRLSPAEIRAGAKARC